MKKYILIATIIFLFGGCTTHRKISKSQSDLKIEKNIESVSEVIEAKSSIQHGITDVVESSTVEEVTFKKPVNIELTANFRIDSTAFLRGDTAMKLVDITNKNVSVTIYQNGKTKVLTAKIKSNGKIQDVPFSEISIKKSKFNKSTSIDTSKVDSSKIQKKSTFSDKSKLAATESSTERDTQKVNYLSLVGLLVLLGLLFWWLNKN